MLLVRHPQISNLGMPPIAYLDTPNLTRVEHWSGLQGFLRLRLPTTAIRMADRANKKTSLQFFAKNLSSAPAGFEGSLTMGPNSAGFSTYRIQYLSIYVHRGSRIGPCTSLMRTI